jgi:hypothetical protein
MHMAVAPAQAPIWSNLRRPPGRTEGLAPSPSEQANGRPDGWGRGALGRSSIPPGTNASAWAVSPSMIRTSTAISNTPPSGWASIEKNVAIAEIEATTIRASARPSR